MNFVKFLEINFKENISILYVPTWNMQIIDYPKDHDSL